MKNKALIVGFLIAASLAHSSGICDQLSAPALRPFAERAVSSEPKVAAKAINYLRAQGPAGLQALLDVNEPLLDQPDRGGIRLSSPEARAANQRLEAALDAVGAQRDCEASRLYWYTNFDQAEAATKVCGKPILSLRLLGKLTVKGPLQSTDTVRRREGAVSLRFQHIPERRAHRRFIFDD